MFMKIQLLLLFFLIITGQQTARAQLAPKRTLEAVRIQEKINLDANLDEPAWQMATAATNFLFSWPTPGRPATERTEVKILYDDAALYIGVHCFDAHPDSIFHRLSKRDELENSDHFSVILDTYKDGQNAVLFGVSPDNVQFDSKFSRANANPNNGDADGEDAAWDAVWRSAAKITADGWVAEMAIPYSALRFPKKDVQEWGLNFSRVIKRRGENDSWNEIKAEISGSINQSGILSGIRNIKAPLRLSATPFVATYANNVYHQPTTPTSDWAYPYSVGMDIKYGLNEAFTLDATVIPDFGQVRTDNYVLNLSPFEVRFNENRPFFTEGTELFNKGGLFYSRRVGANARLLNATKISGRTSKGLGIGVFNAVERAEYDTYQDSEGQTYREEASPLTNSNIIVLDQNLKNNSSVTFINTSVLRSGSATDANVTGGLFNLKNKAQSYALSGQLVGSTRLQPGTAENGFSTSLDLTKTSGKFQWGATYVLESEHYNPNDLGFLFSPNENSGTGWISFNRYKPWWKLNNFWSSAWAYNSMLYRPANTWTETAFGFNFGGNTKKFQNFGMNSKWSPWGINDYYEPRTDDFQHYYHQPATGDVSAWYNSDNRKHLIYYLNTGASFSAEKGRNYHYLYTGLRWRASDKLTLSLGIGNERGNNTIGGIGDNLYATAQGFGELPENSIVMGRRRTDQFNNDLGATYAFNNRMSVALFSRHYWSRVQYKSFYDLQNDGSLVPSAYTGLDAGGNPLNDISANYFNIDLVYTWRFAPGSDVVLVYKNFIGQEADGLDCRHSYTYNLGHLPDYAGSNSLSIKVLYYLDYEKMKKLL